MSVKEQIKRIPVLGSIARQVYRMINKPQVFPGSIEYWENRYASGGNSGAGSYEELAEFKSEVLNSFVCKNNVRSVIEFGCGDGNQLMLADYAAYIGFDVSPTIIDVCKTKFSSATNMQFNLMGEYNGETADLSLSLDVIYHLIEDEIFEHYMEVLFKAANQYVIIYASNTEKNRGSMGTHVRHRKFTTWVEKNMPKWMLIEHIENKYPYVKDCETGSFADFYVYKIGRG